MEIEDAFAFNKVVAEELARHIDPNLPGKTVVFAVSDAHADIVVDQLNIVQATPFQRDPLKELAAECRRQGVKLGFYYSQDQDWTAPGGAAYKTGDHQRSQWTWGGWQTA